MKLGFGKSITYSPEQRAAINQITEWIKKLIFDQNLDKYRDGQIMITEISCSDPGCVPIETLVIIAPSNPEIKRINEKILKPCIEVCFEDVISLNLFVDKRIQRITDEFEALMKRNLQEFTSQDEKLRLVNSIQHMLVTTANILVGESTTNSESQNQSLDSSLTSPSPKPISIVMMKRKDPPSVSTPVLTPLPSSSVPSSDPPAPRIPILPPSPTSSPIVTSSSEITSMSSSLPPPSVQSTSNKTSALPKPPVVTLSGGGSSLNFDSSFGSRGGRPRHEKGTRPRGCPCCDPDNIDNIVDKLFLETPL